MPARHLVRRLVEEIRSVEQAARGREEQPHFSTGIAPLDSLLPGGGLCRGMLVEWLPAMDEGGSGVSLLALLTARAAQSNSESGARNSELSEVVVVIDRHGMFYPPAAAAWGLPLASMILVRPSHVRDEAWALDHALRSPAVAAVLAWPNRLDGRAFRRLQLAAESSGTIGVLVRPAPARKEPTWADVRLRVTSGRVGTAHRNSGFQISDSGLGGDPPHPEFLREEVPNPRGWRFCIQRLHARASVHSPDAVQIEITPTGRIQPIASAKSSPSQTQPHNRAAIRNLKSAI